MNSRTRKRAGAIAVALAMAGALLAPTQAFAADSDILDTPLTLETGHIDAFNPVLADDGSLRLALKEDVTGSHVLHTPESVELFVKPAALTTDFPAAYAPPGMPSTVYYLPLTQDPNIIWPGWDTQAITSAFPDADTGIVVSAIDGPGQVYVWSNGVFGDIKPLMAGGGYELPGTISQPYPAHTHANWAFTAPGTYKFTVRADVSASNGSTGSTQTATYTFVVAERTQLTPQAPTQEGNTVTIPDQPWMTYTDSSGNALAPGAHELTEDLAVTATPALGFDLATGATASWSFSYQAAPQQTIEITGLSAHYHQGSPIQVSVSATPAVTEGSYEWFVQRVDQPAPVKVEGATGSALTLAAEQAFDNARITARLLAADGTTELAAAPAVTIDINDHGAGPFNVVTISGLADHYHTGSTASLTASVAPASVLTHWVWEVQRTGETEWTAIDGASTAAYSFEVTEDLNGASVRARLTFDDGAPYIASAPAVIEIDDHHGEEPVETTLSISGLAAHYHTGDVANLTAVQNPQTDEDHYHWFIKRAGDADYTVISGQLAANLAYTVQEGDDGAEIIARLYDHDHTVIAESAPAVIEIDDHHGEEPVETTLSISGLATHYHTGGTANLTAVQDPQTDEDHYHWFIKRTGDADYSVLSGELTANLAYTVQEGDDGAQIIARLYDHDHTMLAESAPVVLEIDDHHEPAPTKPGEAPASPGEDSLDGVAAGGIQLDKSSVEAGGTVTVQVGEGAQHAGEWVAPWLFSTPVLLGGDWAQVAADGRIVLTIPAGTAPGTHSIAVYAADGALIGWQAIQVTAAGTPSDPGQGSVLTSTGAELSGLAIGGIALLALATGAAFIARRRPTAE